MFNIFKKNNKDSVENFLSNEKSNLEKAHFDFSKLVYISFFDENLVDKVKTIYKDYEFNLKRFLILNYNQSDKKPLLLTNEHDRLFKKFVLKPNDEFAKDSYINFCKDNGIKYNPKTINNIVIFSNFEREIEKNMVNMKKLTNVLKEKIKSNDDQVVIVENNMDNHNSLSNKNKQ